jgi:CRISPR-associated protein Cst2
MVQLKNITGSILIDARAVFLNGAGLNTGENKNQVIPKSFKERGANGNLEEVPYVSAQSWRRWLRNTVNEENNWKESELKVIGVSEGKQSSNKISTELNPIDFPEDDLFGYMRSGGNTEEDKDKPKEDVKKEKKEKKESVQRTSPMKTSILKGIVGKRTFTVDEAFVHPKEGTPLPYSTRFYSTHLEGFFNLEYSRLGVYENLSSHVELAKEIISHHKEKLNEEDIYGGRFKKYTLKDAEIKRKERATGLLKGLVVLRGGAKMAAFGADVSPKVLILAGMECANPIFNDLFDGKSEKPSLKIDVLKEIAKDYQPKLATPIYIGIRTGYLQNEVDIKALSEEGFVVGSPIEITNEFIKNHLT